MPYLKLFHGRQRPDASLEDEARPGPIFGPWPYFLAVGGSEIHFDHDACVLQMVGGQVYYDGHFYADWSVFEGPPSDEDRHRLTAFDPDKAKPPHAYVEGADKSAPCVCMEPGYFHCGVPGILAHVENGRVVPGFHVERCDACRRFETDADAEVRLRELELFAADDPRSLPPDAHQRTYAVHCYATVRVKLPGIPAIDERDAARRAGELFDWDRYHTESEYADEITEYLVDVEGDADYSRSRRFNRDFEPVET